MFPNVFKIYKSVCTDLISPKRSYYPEEFLGKSVDKEGTIFYRKSNLSVKNIKGQVLQVSLFEPTGSQNPEDNTDLVFDGDQPADLQDVQQKDLVIYLHSYNGNQTEGLFLKRHLLNKGKSICLFDFHGQGKSDGKTISFGHFETLDIDALVRYFSKERPFKTISFWGRSTGAIAGLLYLSGEFRHEISRQVRLTRTPRDIFYPSSRISSLVCDSPWPSVGTSLERLISREYRHLPSLLTQGLLRLIDSRVEDIAKFSLFEVEVAEKIKSMLTPVYFILGYRDELIDLDDFTDMFIDCPLIKVMKCVPGGHYDERDDHFVADGIRFITDFTDNPETIEGARLFRHELLTEKAENKEPRVFPPQPGERIPEEEAFKEASSKKRTSKSFREEEVFSKKL